MKKIFIVLTSLAVALAILPGCSTSKKAAAPSTPSMPSTSTSTGGAVGLPRDLVAVSKSVEPAGEKERNRVLDAIVWSYKPWTEVMLEGKLSMKGLPVDPTAKIYMERGTTVMISVRAPILGEVARIEIADQKILMANRLKKVYASDDLEHFLSRVEMSITDVQDILLGRVFVLGRGTLDASNAASMVVTKVPSDRWIVTPVRQPAKVNYGFAVSQDYMMQILFAESIDGRYQANAEYDWKGTSGKKDVDLRIVVDDKEYSPSFSFKAPDFSPKPMTRISVEKGWKKVSLREFMTSF